jgi:putative membrane protein
VAYLWLKALHVISVIAWFAGLFYIFRLYVYHVENKDEPILAKQFQVMEYRLYRYICWPAAISTLVFGIAMVTQATYLLSLRWFWVKLAAVFVLFGYHFLSGKVQRDFAAGNYWLTSRQCRMINEVPTLLLFVIVIMVIVRPALGAW